MPNVAQLVITMDDTGQISVTGPIDNKILAYGLLEVAKEVVQKRTGEQRIAIPAPGLRVVSKN